MADEIMEAPQRVRLAYEKCLIAAETVAIDKANGYGEIGIFTPQEVVEDENEDV